MFYDMIYILPALIFTLWASARVKSAYQKYSQQYASSGLNAAAAARRILDASGCRDVRIERVAGELSDHYDPRENVIRLSEGVYGSSSIAALGIAAHECGHAIQYAQNYFPIRIRTTIIPMTNFASKFAVPMVLLGILLTYLGEAFLGIAYAGVILYGFCVLFQLVTLPVEFNASRRAMGVLEGESLLSSAELGGARKVLSAAAMTYVAALASSLMQMLRLLAIVNNNRRRR